MKNTPAPGLVAPTLPPRPVAGPDLARARRPGLVWPSEQSGAAELPASGPGQKCIIIGPVMNRRAEPPFARSFPFGTVGARCLAPSARRQGRPHSSRALLLVVGAKNFQPERIRKVRRA